MFQKFLAYLQRFKRSFLRLGLAAQTPCNERLSL